MTISLAQSLRKIEEIHDPIILATDPEMLDFMETVQRVGGEALRRADDDELVGAVCLIKSIACTDLLQEGNVEGFMKVMTSDYMDDVLAIALKVSIGLAAMEEWR